MKNGHSDDAWLVFRNCGKGKRAVTMVKVEMEMEMKLVGNLLDELDGKTD